MDKLGMTKRAFTLLELIIVIIIIGILATLGFTQYARMMERSRGAEAKMVCGTLRTAAIGLFLEKRSLSGWNNALAGIGNTTANRNLIPGPGAANCTATNYFYYTTGVSGSDNVTIIATRCNASGKQPQGDSANELILISNLTSGVDTWIGSY